MNMTKDNHNTICRDWRGLTVNIMKEYRVEYQFENSIYWNKFRDYKSEAGAWDSFKYHQEIGNDKYKFRVVWLVYHMTNYYDVIEHITYRNIWYHKPYY